MAKKSTKKKTKSAKKKRAHKYEDKLVVNASFDEVLKASAGKLIKK